MQELYEHLTHIIANQKLTSLFQPIVCLRTKTIFAYEALIRGPSDSPLHSPVNLFGVAENSGQTVLLEHVCRKVNIKQFAEQQLPQKLFLNVSPEILLEPGFKKGETLKVLEKCNILPSRVTIEITEQQPTENYHLMRDAIAHYRNMGFEIAMDDLGAGYSGLRLWTELLPDYVKIDRHFIQNIDKDPVKLNFVRSLKSMATATSCELIAEGIETEAEYRAVENLGIRLVQGYYFSRPEAWAVKTIPGKLFSFQTPNEQAGALKSFVYVKNILQKARSVKPQTRNKEVLKIFQKESQLTTLPIVEAGKVTGLIYKDQFLTQLFASQYGLELYGNKFIQSFAGEMPMIFDENTSIEDVSRQLTENLRADMAFIITRDGEYSGIGTVMDLLQLITQQQVQNAKHANPLTLLPGVTPINQLIDSLLAKRTRFTIAYFDLDNFKPFNDVYGYDKGDQAIKLVAMLLSDSVMDGQGYVGHIGGDDFIVVFTGQDWENNCKNVLSTFQKKAPNLYSEEDRLAGGINSYDRKGNSCFFPLLSLSIGIVNADAMLNCQSHIDIADLAAEAKHQAKKIEGNSYFINRRIPGNYRNRILADCVIKDANDRLMSL